MKSKKKNKILNFSRNKELVDRSLRLWRDYKLGKITKMEYKLLQDTTIQEIREANRSGEED